MLKYFPLMTPNAGSCWWGCASGVFLNKGGFQRGTLKRFPVQFALLSKTKDSYLLWKYQGVTHLNGQNLFGYVDGSKTAPLSTISNTLNGSNQPILIPNSEYVSWSQQDQLIPRHTDCIPLRVILSQVLGFNTSCTLWENPFVTSVTTQVNPLFLDELYGHLLAHAAKLSFSTHLF